jgi:protein-S-isoprenylcysteine O-methyltransferase Ste14
MIAWVNLSIVFLLHSPFLVLLSFIWLPAEYIMVMAEGKDLLIRFGQSYDRYSKCTGSFLPRINKLD